MEATQSLFNKCNKFIYSLKKQLSCDGYEFELNKNKDCSWVIGLLGINNTVLATNLFPKLFKFFTL